MPTRLADAHKSIDRFICEAEQCAQKKMGFAALLTIFPVVLAVSEAVGRYENPSFEGKIKGLFKNFVPHMDDKSWLVSRQPASVLADEVVAEKLEYIRNGLVHELSIPNDMHMSNTKSEVVEAFKTQRAAKYVICVVEFVEAVKVAVDTIVKDYADAELDRQPQPSQDSRSPAQQIETPSLASGSTPMIGG